MRTFCRVRTKEIRRVLFSLRNKRNTKPQENATKEKYNWLGNVINKINIIVRK